MHFHILYTPLHVNCFVYFSIYYMCDSLDVGIAFGYHFIISLVTGKNKYETKDI